MMAAPLGVIAMVCVAIWTLVTSPHLWDLAVIELIVAIFLAIFFAFYLNYAKRKLKAMEDELAEVEKQQTLSRQNVDEDIDTKE